MLGLVLADNLLVLFTCWELTSITSYLLIGNDHTDGQRPCRRAAGAARHRRRRPGDARRVRAARPGGRHLPRSASCSPTRRRARRSRSALVLVLLGAFTKSAQYPFHSWLPGAMAAPTPVSAYLHSATMVKAGVYLVARFAPAFATSPPWRPLVLTVGAVDDGRRRAARAAPARPQAAARFGTVSQLGFLMVLFGVGTPRPRPPACVLLLAHAAFKAALFMVVGIIDHQTGTRDIRAHARRSAPAWRPSRSSRSVQPRRWPASR